MNKVNFLVMDKNTETLKYSKLRQNFANPLSKILDKLIKITIPNLLYSVQFELFLHIYDIFNKLKIFLSFLEIQFNCKLLFLHPLID